MSNVTFHHAGPADAILKYVVIAARYRGKWILCRHKDRNTWEIPGGHIEPMETPDQAAARELWEETGARKAELRQICVYSCQDYGVLYYADIIEQGPIPNFSEIAETGCFDELPDNLTYPHIQPELFDMIQNWLKST